MSPTPKPGILEVSLYVGGRSSAPGAQKVVKLSSKRVSPLGPSPKAMEACAPPRIPGGFIPMAAPGCCVRRFGEVHGLDLRPHVAGGRGSGPLLTMLANAYLQPGDEVIISRHAFQVYEIVTRANSATPVIVP